METTTTSIEDLVFVAGQDAIDAFGSDPLFGPVIVTFAADPVTVIFTDDREPGAGAIAFTVERDGESIYSGHLDPSGDPIFDGF